jgi:hypothetical protein
MKPETEVNINEAIDWLQQTGESLQDFASEQAPLYCREVVAWELWSGAIFTGFGIILATIGIIALMKFIRWMNEDEGEPNHRTVPSMIVALLGIVIGPMQIIHHAPKSIKAVVSPRMVIIEHFRGLTK